MRLSITEFLEWKVMYRLLTWTLSKFSRDYIHQVVQGSTERHDARCGCCLVTRALEDSHHEPDVVEVEEVSK